MKLFIIFNHSFNFDFEPDTNLKLAVYKGNKGLMKEYYSLL